MYQPWWWSLDTFTDTLRSSTRGDRIYLDPLVRTLLYVGIASLICLVLGYAVAYYTARHAGRWRGSGPRPAHLAVLDQLPDADLRLAEPAPARRVHQRRRSASSASRRSNWLAGKPVTVILGLVYGYIPFMILPLFGFLDRIDQSVLEAGRDLGAGPLETFRRVTLPLSKPGDPRRARDRVAADVRRLLHEQPAREHETSMYGNLIDSAVGQAGQGPEAGSLVLILDRARHGPDALLPPIDPASDGGGMSETTLTPERRVAAAPARSTTGWLRNPWRKPRFLQAVTWGYIAWSIVPVVIAIVFSFNAGRSRSTWQGFSIRWWYQDAVRLRSGTIPALRSAMFQTFRLVDPHDADRGPARHGVRDRHRPVARPARRARRTSSCSSRSSCPRSSSASRCSCCSRACSRRCVQLGTTAQILGLVTFQLSYPVIIVRARLLSIGPEFEEAAMDLGASPTQALRRVLLPLLGAGDPRERRARVRRLRRQLRDRPVPVGPRRRPNRCR